jgi:hypothetical protein
MSDYDRFHQDVLSDALTCGGSEASLYETNPEKVDIALAAAAYVVNARGVEWCQANPKEFVKATWSQLGFWIQVGIFFASLFSAGAPLWLQILEWILPYAIKWFTSQAQAGTCSAEDISVMAREAETFVRKKRRHAR